MVVVVVVVVPVAVLESDEWPWFASSFGPEVFDMLVPGPEPSPRILVGNNLAKTTVPCSSSSCCCWRRKVGTFEWYGHFFGLVGAAIRFGVDDIYVLFVVASSSL